MNSYQGMGIARGSVFPARPRDPPTTHPVNYESTDAIDWHCSFHSWILHSVSIHHTHTHIPTLPFHIHTGFLVCFALLPPVLPG